MSKRRPVLAAAITLALLGGGLVAAGAAQAHRASPSKPTTVATPKPRTKNAALPTTTKPKTVTTPVPQLPRTKNAALPPTTAPKTVTTPKPALPRTGTTRVPTSNTLKR
jgi:hypothetical protein